MQLRSEPSPLTPARSPAAQRFAPPVHACHWKTDAELSLAALVAEAGARLGRAQLAERALWHGGIHVSGRPVDCDTPPAVIAAGSAISVYALAYEPEPIALAPARILYDDGALVAVDKPAWLTTQRSRASVRLSLEAALRALLGDASLVAVHRLDRETSGLVLFARGTQAARWCGRELRERRVEKRYLAVVSPAPREERFAVTGALGRVRDPRRIRFALGGELYAPRASASRFRVLSRGEGCAGVECVPLTGRTHQLRVHLASVASPIAGDDLYGAAWSPGAPERTLLHAAELILRRPSGQWLALTAPPPPEEWGRWFKSSKVTDHQQVNF